ncbi:hypothetical protein [Apilactobacillus micheneri]|uniref:hypothetical protein n=1 Tax=Apilactobacillus micheneri TaxID=1899430 RepID=UPI000D023AEA|nr:hypothetical protein [Apilactobacillus micheneri]
MPVVSTDGGVILNKQTGEIYGAYVSNQNLDFASGDYDRQFAGNINFSGIYINNFSEQDTAPGNFYYSGKYKARSNSGSINLYFDANRLSGMIAGEKTIPVHMYVSFTTI